MDEPFVLSRAFFLRAPQTYQSPTSAPLEQALCACWERGRSAWPAIALPANIFVGHLGGCLRDGMDPQRLLATVHAGDLYLACACAQGIPPAVMALEQDFLSRHEVSAMLARVDPAPSFIDEARQALRERLLVRPPSGTPKIGEFSGEGGLLGWLETTAVRVAHNLRRNRDDRPSEDIDLAEKVLYGGRNPEQEYLKARFQQEFKEAFSAAFAALLPEQQNTIRWKYQDGCTGEQIAAMLGVTRRTAVRRLAEVREALRQETRRLLGLSDSGFESLMGLVGSGFDLSISKLLGG